MTRLKKKGWSIALACALVMSYQSVQTPQLIEGCEAVHSLDDAMCFAASSLVAETVSWHDWFTGQSASVQFHFLDLLELLYQRD